MIGPANGRLRYGCGSLFRELSDDGPYDEFLLLARPEDRAAPLIIAALHLRGPLLPVDSVKVDVSFSVDEEVVGIVA